MIMAGIKWWTPARLDFLRALAGAGYQSPAIARALTRRYHRRVTPMAVRSVAARAGIRLPGGAPRGNANARGTAQ